MWQPIRTVLVLQVVGRAVSRDGDLVYSEDRVELRVVPLAGLRLETPLKRLVVGSSMPVYLVGDGEGEDVYSWASAVPHLSVEWLLKGEGAVDTPWAGAGLVMDNTNAGVAVFRATRAGRSTVTARMTITAKMPLADQFQLTENQVMMKMMMI